MPKLAVQYNGCQSYIQLHAPSAEGLYYDVRQTLLTTLREELVELGYYDGSYFSVTDDQSLLELLGIDEPCLVVKTKGHTLEVKTLVDAENELPFIKDADAVVENDVPRVKTEDVEMASLPWLDIVSQLSLSNHITQTTKSLCYFSQTITLLSLIELQARELWSDILRGFVLDIRTRMWMERQVCNQVDGQPLVQQADRSTSFNLNKDGTSYTILHPDCMFSEGNTELYPALHTLNKHQPQKLFQTQREYLISVLSHVFLTDATPLLETVLVTEGLVRDILSYDILDITEASSQLGVAVECLSLGEVVPNSAQLAHRSGVSNLEYITFTMHDMAQEMDYLPSLLSRLMTVSNVYTLAYVHYFKKVLKWYLDHSYNAQTSVVHAAFIVFEITDEFCDILRDTLGVDPKEISHLYCSKLSALYLTHSLLAPFIDNVHDQTGLMITKIIMLVECGIPCIITDSGHGARDLIRCISLFITSSDKPAYFKDFKQLPNSGLQLGQVPCDNNLYIVNCATDQLKNLIKPKHSIICVYNTQEEGKDKLKEPGVLYVGAVETVKLFEECGAVIRTHYITKNTLKTPWECRVVESVMSEVLGEAYDCVVMGATPDCVATPSDETIRKQLLKIKDCVQSGGVLALCNMHYIYPYISYLLDKQFSEEGDEYYVECGGDFWPVHNDFTLVIVSSKQKQGPSQFDLSVKVKVPLPLCVDTLRALHDWSEEKGWCIEPLLPLTRGGHTQEACKEKLVRCVPDRSYYTGLQHEQDRCQIEKFRHEKPKDFPNYLQAFSKRSGVRRAVVTTLTDLLNVELFQTLNSLQVENITMRTEVRTGVSLDDTYTDSITSCLVIICTDNDIVHQALVELYRSGKEFVLVINIASFTVKDLLFCSRDVDFIHLDQLFPVEETPLLPTLSSLHPLSLHDIIYTNNVIPQLLTSELLPNLLKDDRVPLLFVLEPFLKNLELRVKLRYSEPEWMMSIVMDNCKQDVPLREILFSEMMFRVAEVIKELVREIDLNDNLSLFGGESEKRWVELYKMYAPNVHKPGKVIDNTQGVTFPFSWCIISEVVEVIKVFQNTCLDPSKHFDLVARVVGKRCAESGISSRVLLRLFFKDVWSTFIAATDEKLYLNVLKAIEVVCDSGLIGRDGFSWLIYCVMYIYQHRLNLRDMASLEKFLPENNDIILGPCTLDGLVNIIYEEDNISDDCIAALKHLRKEPKGKHVSALIDELLFKHEGQEICKKADYPDPCRTIYETRYEPDGKPYQAKITDPTLDVPLEEYINAFAQILKLHPNNADLIKDMSSFFLKYFHCLDISQFTSIRNVCKLVLSKEITHDTQENIPEFNNLQSVLFYLIYSRIGLERTLVNLDLFCQTDYGTLHTQTVRNFVSFVSELCCAEEQIPPPIFNKNGEIIDKDGNMLTYEGCIEHMTDGVHYFRDIGKAVKARLHLDALAKALLPKEGLSADLKEVLAAGNSELRKLYLIRRLVAEHGLNVTQRLLHKEEGARVKRQKQSDEVKEDQADVYRVLGTQYTTLWNSVQMMSLDHTLVSDDVQHHPLASDDVQHHPSDDVQHHARDDVQHHPSDDVQHHPLSTKHPNLVLLVFYTMKEEWVADLVRKTLNTTAHDSFLADVTQGRLFGLPSWSHSASPLVLLYTALQGPATNLLTKFLVQVYQYPIRCKELFLPTMREDVLEKFKTQLGEKYALTPNHPYTWYKCNNNHVYAINNCGEPLQEGKCFCGADIGGLKHNLVKGNRRLDGYNKFNEKGHNLPPVSLRGVLDSERDLNSVMLGLLRWLLHAAFICSEDISACAANFECEGDVRKFLQEHLIRDFEGITTGLQCNSEQAVVWLVTVIAQIFNTESLGEEMCVSKASRAELEQYCSTLARPLVNTAASLIQAGHEAMYSGEQDVRLYLGLKDPKVGASVTDRALIAPLHTSKLNILTHYSLTNPNVSCALTNFTKCHVLLVLTLDLPAIVKSVQELVKRFSYRLSLEEAQCSLVRDYIASDTLKAWSRTWQRVRSVSVVDNIVLTEEMRVLDLSEDSKLSYFLPCIKGDGVCAKFLLDTLVKLHNDCCGKSEGESEGVQVVYNESEVLACILSPPYTELEHYLANRRRVEYSGTTLVYRRESMTWNNTLNKFNAEHPVEKPAPWILEQILTSPKLSQHLASCETLILLRLNHQKIQLRELVEIYQLDWAFPDVRPENLVYLWHYVYFELSVICENPFELIRRQARIDDYVACIDIEDWNVEYEKPERLSRDDLFILHALTVSWIVLDPGFDTSGMNVREALDFYSENSVIQFDCAAVQAVAPESMKMRHLPEYWFTLSKGFIM